MLDEAREIFTGNEVSNFPEHKCFEAGDSVQERMARIFDYTVDLISTDARINPNERGATYIFKFLFLTRSFASRFLLRFAKPFLANTAWF